MTNWIKVENQLINTDICSSISKSVSCLGSLMVDGIFDDLITIYFKDKNGKNLAEISFTNKAKANREFKRLQYLLTKK